MRNIVEISIENCKMPLYQYYLLVPLFTLNAIDAKWEADTVN